MRLSLVLTLLSAMEYNTVDYVERSSALGVGCIYPRDAGNNNESTYTNDEIFNPSLKTSHVYTPTRLGHVLSFEGTT